VLPDADDLQVLAAELAVHAFIVSHVVFAFFVPELSVCFGPRVAIGAAVPKASTDKDGVLLLGKGKVGLAGQRKMPSPPGYAVLAQQGQQRILRFLVGLAPDEGHDLRSF
jgi:hypothetical protein